MSAYLTKVALSIRGDRIEKNTEIELTAEEAANFDPKDLELVDGNSGAVEIEAEAPVPLEEMTSAQLKARAKELGLSAGGSAADLRERITLHLEGNATGDQSEGDSEGGEDATGDQSEG